MKDREKGTCCLHRRAITEGSGAFQGPYVKWIKDNLGGQHTGVLEEAGRIGFKLPSVMGDQGASNVTSMEEKQPRARKGQWCKGWGLEDGPWARCFPYWGSCFPSQCKNEVRLEDRHSRSKPLRSH